MFVSLLGGNTLGNDSFFSFFGKRKISVYTERVFSAADFQSDGRSRLQFEKLSREVYIRVKLACDEQSLMTVSKKCFVLTFVHSSLHHHSCIHHFKLTANDH